MVPRYKFLFQIIFFIIASNTLLSEVTVSIGNVSVGGYTEDIVVPVTVSNPSATVGGFQFDVIAMPAIINLSGVSPINENNFLQIIIFLMMVLLELYFIQIQALVLLLEVKRFF